MVSPSRTRRSTAFADVRASSSTTSRCYSRFLPMFSPFWVPAPRLWSLASALLRACTRQTANAIVMWLMPVRNSAVAVCWSVRRLMSHQLKRYGRSIRSICKVFPAASVIVHHGGFGTCAEPLRAGKGSLVYAVRSRSARYRGSFFALRPKASRRQILL
jgi:hypothetical protein